LNVKANLRGDQARLGQAQCKFAFDGSYSLNLAETFTMGRFQAIYQLQSQIAGLTAARILKRRVLFAVAMFMVLIVKGNSFIIALDGRWKGGFNVSNLWRVKLKI